jgi:flap endonuclease-1
MGVKLLNTFLKSLQCEGIRKISLTDLAGKKIAVDISIYLYRYLHQDALIEKIFQMCSIFRRYNIHPLFIFDGKASKLKAATLMKRRERRKRAEEEYNRCQDKIFQSPNGEKNKILKKKLWDLKKKMTRLTYKNICEIKILLDLYGLQWIQAYGEADELCAALVRSKSVYACLSEDTDMFILETPRILKYFSLINHTCVMYETSKILTFLGMDWQSFRHLCIIAGTDYNKQIGNLFSYYDLFTEFKAKNQISFIQWLTKRHITIQNYNKIIDMNDFYEMVPLDILKQYTYKTIINRPMKEDKLKNFLQKNNFVFSHNNYHLRRLRR